MKLLVCILVLLLPIGAFAQVFEVETIKEAGPVESRINLVFLPDGYTQEEMDNFRSDVQSITDEIFSMDFFYQYSDFINVHLIKVPSNESGADHPGTAQDENGTVPIVDVDNYFGSSFDNNGIHRALVPYHTSRVFNVLADNFPMYDEVIILVNTPYAGGTGGLFATVSAGSTPTETVLHELGHTFADLGDEYDYAGGGYPREKPNVTSVTQRELIRWKAWIEDTTPIPTPETGAYVNDVGLFEGAIYQPTGWYRPKYFCKMRVLGIEFCEVCTERFISEFYKRVPPLTVISPDPVYTVTGEESIEFKTELVGSDLINYSYEWKVNGEMTNYFDPSITLKFNDSRLEATTVELIVRDTTELVRSESLEFKTSWTIYGSLKNATDDAGLLAVNTLTLVNPHRDEDIKVLSDIDYWYLPDNWKPTIRADVSDPDLVESVVFTINGRVANIENNAPYALAGNRGADYFDNILSHGVYTVCATPYTRNMGEGAAGESKCVTLVLQFTLPEGISASGEIQSRKGSYLEDPDAEGRARYSLQATYDHETREYSGNGFFSFGRANLNFKSTSLLLFYQRKIKATLFWNGEIDGVDDYLMEQRFLYRNDHTLARIRITRKSDGVLIYDSQRGTDPWDRPEERAINETHFIGDPVWTIIDDEVSGIQSNLLEVYPNPFNETLNLAVPVFDTKTVQLRITDMLGRVVINRSMESGQTSRINTSGLSKGIYILFVSSGDQVYSFRLAK